MVTTSERPLFKPAIAGRAAIYIRVSSQKQEDGASLSFQLDTCRSFCDKAGYDVVGEFRDVQSGLDVDRPGYQAALKLAKVKGFDFLVVYRYDRSGRDDAEFAMMLRDFAKQGIQLISASGEPIDPFSQRLMGLLAWNESRTISVRASGGKMKRHTEGFWNGKPVFGYSLAKHESGGTYLVPKEGEAELVTELFASYATGNVSLAALQRHLAAAGVVKNRAAVWYILRNRTYVGEVPHGIKNTSKFMPQAELNWTPGKHQPLTDPETFECVQHRLRVNAQMQRSGPDHRRYLFSGLILCGSCGRRYTAKASKVKGEVVVQYRCNGRISAGDCKASFIHESRVRATVIPPIEAMIAKLSDVDLREAVRAEIVRQQQEAVTAAQATSRGASEQIARLEARLTSLEDAMLDGEISKERYRVRRDDLLGQIQELRPQVDQRPQVVAPDLDQLFALADSLAGEPLDDQEWRAVIEGTVEKITISGRDIVVEWKPSFRPLLELTDEK
jgi:site-specific DNA recombinase